jgi:hypothetical protein
VPLFRKKSKQADAVEDHAVLVHIAGPSEGDEFALDEVEDRLIAAIDAAKVGEFDGNLIGPDGATLYMYGPDGERLFAVVEPVLRGAALPAGSLVIIRAGGPGAKQRQVAI